MRALLLVGLLAAPVYSDETGAAFLKLPVGARAVGMGQAYTAVASGAEALQWNPAGVAALKGTELSAGHARMYEGLSHGFVGLARSNDGFGWAAGVARLSHGEFEGRDASRRRTAAFTASDTWAGLAFAAQFGPRKAPARLGIGVKALQSRVADRSASGFAVDVGLQRETLIRGVSVGLAVRNLGSGLKFEREAAELPLTLSAGVAYASPVGLTLSVEGRHEPRAKKTVANVGAEWTLMNAVSLRAGYSANPQALSQGTSRDLLRAAGLGAGLGLKLRGLKLDYAFTPNGELDAVQRVSVTARF